MRDYIGVPYSRVDDPVIRRSLSVIDFFLRDLSRGIGRVQNGEVPDGSGDPLAPAEIDTSLFFLLPGRDPNQNAHGSTLAGGDLILHSTSHATLGSIFLGDFSEYDEVNDRLGIFKLAPAAALEIAQAFDPIYWRPISLINPTTTWRGQDGGVDTWLYVDEAIPDDADYISQGLGNGASICAMYLTANSTPDVSAVHTFRVRVRRVDAGSVTDPDFLYALDSNGNNVFSVTSSVGTSFTTLTHVLSGAEVALILSVSGGSYALLSVSMRGTGGTAPDYFEVSWIEMEVTSAAATNLTHWDVDAGATVQSIVDSVARFGIGTGDVGLGSQLTVVGGDFPAMDVTGRSSFDNSAAFDGPAVSVATDISSSSYQGAGGLSFLDYSTGFRAEVVINTAALTADRFLEVPDGSGQIIIAGATQTLTSKTMATSTTLKVSNSGTGAAFSDQGTASKILRFILSGATGNNVIAVVSTAARTYTLPNVTGQVPIVGDDPPAVAAGAMGKVDAITQAAAIGATNLTNGALTGVYQISYYLEVTTANGTDVSVQFQINYTDTIGATNQTGAVLVLTAQGRDKGVLVAYLASGELSYQTNVVTQTTSRYALRVRVLYLG